ncbi:hypothetical protein ACHAQH_002688 [Verticillium albo-atrum]
MGSTVVDSVAQSCNATYNRPKTRQRVQKPPPALDVPNIDEDATERKRVLNVLAQRRYRERKRDAKTRCRELQDESPPANAALVPSLPHSDLPHAGELSSDVARSSIPQIESRPGPESNMTLDIDLDMTWDALPLETTAMSALAEGFPCAPFEATTWDSLSSSPSSGFSSAFTTDSTALSTINPSYLTTASYSPPSSSSSTSPPGKPFTPPPPVDDFADRYLLPIADLTLLRALINIAARMGCSSEVWLPTANSPFNLGIGPPASLLPVPFRPTPTQLQLPHHPVLDFLPWPSVRDRIISLFNMPSDMRPPGARDPLALMNFAYDMEHQAEGIRIWGGDPYDETGWEVGQIFFERWWFIFDREVVAQSNRLREMRGAARLHLKGPRVEELGG